MKILVIDDSELVLNVIDDMLKAAGFETLLAKNGVEGIEKENKESPDQVIIDTILPDMTGFDVCERIRKSRSEERPKIIMMTGSIDAIDAVRARRAGADDYTVKTSDLRLIIDAVKNFCRP